MFRLHEKCTLKSYLSKIKRIYVETYFIYKNELNYGLQTELLKQ